MRPGKPGQFIVFAIGIRDFIQHPDRGPSAIAADRAANGDDLALGDGALTGGAAPPSRGPTPARVDLPTGLSLALGAVLVVQLGHALAVVLLERIGVMMTAGFRAGFSAVVLLAISRPATRSLEPSQRRLVAIFGCNFVVQSLALYVAISRIPLGIALSIAFLGPLGMAVWRGRRPRDLTCAATALAGVVLLVEMPGASGNVDPIGLLAAAVGASSWAIYIYCSERARATMPRLDGLALSMTLAACVLVPAALIAGPAQPLVPGDVGLGFATALLATAIPFSMESLALSRTPVHLFGILMSTEPAVAALVGFIALGQALPPVAIGGIALVVLASAAATIGGRNDTDAKRYGRGSP